MTAPAKPLIIKIVIGITITLLLLLLVLAMFPWGAFKGRAEQALADRVGAPVTIGAIERRDFFSFSPALDVRDIRIAQPGWAGKGELLRVERASLRLPVLPILIGRIAPEPISIENGRATLIRAKDGRTNWDRGQGKRRGGGGGGGGLEELIVRNLIVDYRDAKRDRRAVVRVDSDANGFRAVGDGALADEPVKIAFNGEAIAKRTAWPFTASIAGPTTQIRLKGTMAAPLDARNMRFDIDARGNDLLDVDRVIEAGLLGTQPVALNGTVERTGEVWRIEKLAGTIGRSRLSSATATVDKSGKRPKIDGTLRLAALDFKDLSNAQGIAKGAAIRAQLGPRVVPGTRIDLKSVSDVDGVLRVRVDRLIGESAGPFRRAAGTLTLDDAWLTVEPFEMGLVRGVLNGRVVIDQRGGKPLPTLTLDLKLDGSTIGTLAGSDAIDAPLRGSVRLSGQGETVRAAVGRSTGSVALVSGQGRIPAKLASFLGLDVGRGVFADKQDVASLRCLIVRMDVARGTARMNPLVIDTSRSQSRVSGTINLATEGLSLSMMGSPKKDSILRLSEPVPIGGTIKAPSPRVPGEKKGVGTVLKMLGDAIAGDRPPLASDADCGGLAAKAMR